MKSDKIISFKGNIISVLLIFFLIALPSCTHSDHSRIVFKNPVGYNQYIVTRQKELIEDVNMVNLSSEHNYPLAIKMLDTLLAHSTQNIEEIKLLSPFKNDSSFKEVAIDEFNFYNKIFVPYSIEMLKIKIKIDSGKATNTDYDNYNEYLKKIKRKSEPIESRLEEMQSKFAKKNNMIITKIKGEDSSSQ
jgi:hypothetical protein